MREPPAAKHASAALLVAAAWLQIGLVGAVVLAATLDRLFDQPGGASMSIQSLSTLLGGLCGGLLAIASWRQGLRTIERARPASASAGALSAATAHR